ncbi:ABC transporter substrate-binding protein [Pseudonocardia acaciae]|uniref:ABC transporter substrate-binding protein n=1 Tax=Pseudonocardia acaciae TaxID=551276 RepID=UPI00048C030D|nr:ABC transporter substrate-binding protein [Pseudonocardia acaciae]
MSARRAVSALVLSAALALTGCGLAGTQNGDGAGRPIMIGTSLPLTGQDSQTGVAVQRGYQVWERMVNERGGILGRRVELKILDDASNQNTVISDFNALLGGYNVDFLIGTFSTRLTVPALSVAERGRKLYLDPAGAAPEIFDRRSPMYFYTEPAPSWNFGVAFARHVAGLPPAERPASVAYVLTKDPFTSSTVTGMRTLLEQAGVRTALSATYQFGERNFDPIASQVKDSGAQLVVNAGGFEDETGFLRALLKAGATPRLLYQSSSPVYPKEYPEAVGAANTEGVFYPAGYSPNLNSRDNAEFVQRFRSEFGTDPGRLSAGAYAAGQVLAAALAAVGARGIADQRALADWLHATSVETVIGPLSWDATGAPLSEFAIGQWQHGVPKVVLPARLATSDRILTCWRSC